MAVVLRPWTLASGGGDWLFKEELRTRRGGVRISYMVVVVRAYTLAPGEGGLFVSCFAVHFSVITPLNMHPRFGPTSSSCWSQDRFNLKATTHPIVLIILHWTQLYAHTRHYMRIP